jgi:hypothetical protein
MFAPTSFVLIATALIGQSNAVAGLDGKLTVIDSMTYYGRRGPAHPNGQIGMAMLNTMCNPGSVNIPWYQAMQPNHPKFGFLVVRVSSDRIEQINEWSFCKHAFLSINVNGSCGTCQNPGTGQLMGLNCSDTYAPGNNASRTWLGPPEEIDPWLGTWDPVGSYFDIGDPRQSNYPAPADGSRSLSQAVFDTVDNRVTVNEIDLTTLGAKYYYGLQLIHEGEALSSRGDNLAHRGMDPTWTGTNWQFPSNQEGQQYGSILTRWNGATVKFGQNGNDDGRIFVAVKTYSIGGGDYHYEYAVHNVDNSRGGASLRFPIAASATASNYSFRDIDGDAANDWTVARVGNEIVFTATPGNALEWNTILNFGFDADFAPGTAYCHVDAARPGAGAMQVDIETTVPGGDTIAQFTLEGTGCPGSVAADCLQFNSTGGPLNVAATNQEIAYRVPEFLPGSIVSFDIWTASTAGTVVLPAHVYAAPIGAPLGAAPDPTPLASTTISIGPVPGFYRATFVMPVSSQSEVYLAVDSASQATLRSDLQSGTVQIAWSRNGTGQSWSASFARPAWRIQCGGAAQYDPPQIGVEGEPVLGATYDLTLGGVITNSAAVLISGLSNTSYNGAPLPAALPGAPGCSVLVAPQALSAVPTSLIGTASYGIAVPASINLMGMRVYHQWAVLDPSVNSLGIVMSGGGTATIGN